MPLKDDLLRKGYLPENLPPAFSSRSMAEYFSVAPPPGYFSNSKSPTRAASYNASKRGLSRRTFSLVHPSTAYDLAEFVSKQEATLTAHFEKSTFSRSVPTHTPDGTRAVEIDSHSDLEAELRTRLSRYRFVAKTDISRFYHSIYTHTIPWALSGRAEAKQDHNVRSATVPFNRLDQIIRCGQDGQTIGIPVGPDASRFVAETITTSIDVEFVRRHPDFAGAVIRHVDDIWIGGDTYSEVENALWRYREAIREFELDINDGKTRIHSSDFRVSDAWPTEISARLDYGLEALPQRARDRLAAAAEYAFNAAASHDDDGVLKYVIRYLDQSQGGWMHWDALEPFLQRSAVHFGHTIDYVARVIVWRQLVHGDLDMQNWSALLVSILDRHGRLGNDSEVCWALYACMRLHVPIPLDVGNEIIRNCGAMSLVAALSCIESNLLPAGAFDEAHDRLGDENACGSLWPVILEWKTREWPASGNIAVANDLVLELIDYEVSLFDANRLPPVFSELQADQFDSVTKAIEGRVSMYDNSDESEAVAPGEEF